jgi:hypothetical protein
MRTRLKGLVPFAVVVVSLLLMVMLAGCNERVAKPELKGEGPLALKLPSGVLSPEYHQPVEYWKQHHMDLIKRGDFNKQECTLCHDVHTSCNNCHEYVGVVKVEGYE